MPGSQSFFPVVSILFVWNIEDEVTLLFEWTRDNPTQEAVYYIRAGQEEGAVKEWLMG